MSILSMLFFESKKLETWEAAKDYSEACGCIRQLGADHSEEILHSILTWTSFFSFLHSTPLLAILRHSKWYRELPLV